MSKPDTIDALARFFDRSREEILNADDSELGDLHKLRDEYLAEQAAAEPAKPEPTSVRVATEQHWHGTEWQEIPMESVPALADWDCRCWQPGRPS
jgi:hypothetical protein